MILRFPQGYDTRIGATSGILTGGQRQRIGLARAVYGQPKLVVLDEPNSSLDEAGDLALLGALQSLKTAGTTVLVVSHRASVLPAIDKLLVLRDGQVAMFGPRDEVRQQLQQEATQATAARAAERGVAPLLRPAPLGPKS
jgi:ABC-type protease/lipase transport system fused ATPase/permease subunit